MQDDYLYIILLQMKYIFEIIYATWFLSEVLLNRLYRSRSKSSKKNDKNSLQLIWGTIIVSMTAGIMASITLPVPLDNAVWPVITGLVLIVLGMVLRFIAIGTLGKFFTVDITIQEEQTLLTNGVYKFIRHPSYSGSLLSFLGFGFSQNNWVSLFVIFVPVLLAFLYRIKLEEKMLLEQFGQAYREYKQKTRRLIPGIY